MPMYCYVYERYNYSEKNDLPSHYMKTKKGLDSALRPNEF